MKYDDASMLVIHGIPLLKLPMCEVMVGKVSFFRRKMFETFAEGRVNTGSAILFLIPLGGWSDSIWPRTTAGGNWT